jgi:hypothetical protein
LSVQSIKKQEKELGQIIAKYRFKEKPERIYYVDDKMLYVPMARSARPYWYPLLAANLK